MALALNFLLVALFHPSFSELLPYQQMALKVHNELRAVHGDAGDLILKEDLTEMAVKCAEYYLERGKMDRTCPHKAYPEKGDANENFFQYKNGELDPSRVAEAATREWYKGIKDWDFEKNRLREGAPRNHEFPQMVCRGTGWLGFGIASSPEKGTFAVALYLGIFKWLWNASVMKKNIITPTKDMVDPRPVWEILGVPSFTPDYFQVLALKKHNDFRVRHPATPEMSLDEELCDLAAKCAHYYVKSKKSEGRYDGKCPHKQTGSRGLAGENFFWHFSDKVDRLKIIESAVAEWYMGSRKWDFEAGAPKKGLRSPKQFVQLICSICHKLGIGVFRNDYRGTFVVALYLERVSGEWKPEKMKSVVLPPLDPDFESKLEQVFVVEPTDYQLSGLEEHNELRALHPGTPPMIMKEGLNKMAEECARHLARNGEARGCGSSLGRHPVKGTPEYNVRCHVPNNFSHHPEELVDSAVREWYSGVEKWDWSKGAKHGWEDQTPTNFLRVVYKFNQWLGIGVYQQEMWSTCVVAAYLDRLPGALEKLEKGTVLPPINLNPGEYAASALHYQQRALELHNELRARHTDTPPMVLMPGLCNLAAKCVQWYLNQTEVTQGACPFKSKGGSGTAGENLYFHTEQFSGQEEKIVVAALREWYAQGLFSWDFSIGFEKDGHAYPDEFAQIVNKKSTHLGVAVGAKEGRGTLIVMLYWERAQRRKKSEKSAPLKSRRGKRIGTQGANPVGSTTISADLLQPEYVNPPTEYQKSALEVHNELRARHNGTPEMIMLESYNSVAQRCAEYYLAQDKFDRRCPFRKKWNPVFTADTGGENHYWVLPSIEDDVFAMNIAVRSWYEQGAYWDFEKSDVKTTELEGSMSFPAMFAQMTVGKNGALGVGLARDSVKGVFVVAIYEADVEKWADQQDVWRENLKPPLVEIQAIPEVGGLKHYQVVGLNVHNELRSRHVDTPMLELDADLSRKAEECAAHYLKSNLTGYSCGSTEGTGQNIHATSGFPLFSDDSCAEAAVRAWYKESTRYDYAEAQYSTTTRHFTQLAWASTLKVGLGLARWHRDKCLVVAFYSPSGNVGGYFETQVKPLKDELVTTTPAARGWEALETVTLSPDDADGADAIQVTDPPEDQAAAELEREIMQHLADIGSTEPTDIADG